MDWKCELGSQLKSARKAAHFTQQALADRLKVSRQMIGKYEKGSVPMPFDLLAHAAAILDTGFDVLDVRVTPAKEAFHLSALRLVPKQLSFDFNRSRSFPNAVIKITPHRGRLLITADIPA